jgi:hypothetical protein
VGIRLTAGVASISIAKELILDTKIYRTGGIVDQDLELHRNLNLVFGGVIVPMFRNIGVIHKRGPFPRSDYMTKTTVS